MRIVLRGMDTGSSKKPLKKSLTEKRMIVVMMVIVNRLWCSRETSSRVICVSRGCRH